MAGIQETGAVHRLLVQRRGHHRLHLSAQREITGAHHIFDRSPARAGTHLPHRRLRQLDVRQVKQRDRPFLEAALCARIDDDLIAGADSQPRRRPAQDALIADHERPASGEHLAMLQRLQHHLRPDAGGVAQRNRQSRTAVIPPANLRAGLVVLSCSVGGFSHCCCSPCACPCLVCRTAAPPLRCTADAIMRARARPIQSKHLAISIKLIYLI